MSILRLNYTCACVVNRREEIQFFCVHWRFVMIAKLFLHKIEMSYTGIRRLPMLCCLLK